MSRVGMKYNDIQITWFWRALISSLSFKLPSLITHLFLSWLFFLFLFLTSPLLSLKTWRYKAWSKFIRLSRKKAKRNCLSFVYLFVFSSTSLSSSRVKEPRQDKAKKGRCAWDPSLYMRNERLLKKWKVQSSKFRSYHIVDPSGYLKLFI